MSHLSLTNESNNIFMTKIKNLKKLLFLNLSFAFTTLYSQNDDSNLTHNNYLTDNSLKGVIKSVKYERLNYKGEFEPMSINSTYKYLAHFILKYPVSYAVFDKEGRVVENDIYGDYSGKKFKVFYTYNAQNEVAKKEYQSKYYGNHIETFSYDEKGNLLEHIISPKGKKSFERKELYYYDAKANLVKYVVIKKRTELNDKTTYNFIYDQNNNRIKKIVKGRFKNIGHIDYQYDQNNRLVLEKSYLKNEIDRIREFTYFSEEEIKSSQYTDKSVAPEKGLKTEHQKNFSHGAIYEQTQKVYDVNGLLLEKAIFKEDTETRRTRDLYEYDKNNRVTKKNKYLFDFIGWSLYTYNEKGYLSERTDYDEKGTVEERLSTTYIYNEKGLPIEEKTVNKEGKIIFHFKITYTYYQ